MSFSFVVLYHQDAKGCSGRQKGYFLDHEGAQYKIFRIR